MTSLFENNLFLNLCIYSATIAMTLGCYNITKALVHKCKFSLFSFPIAILCPFDHWLSVILIFWLIKFLLIISWQKNGFPVPYLARILNAFAGTVIPICMLSHLPAWCFSWARLASMREFGATFRTGLRREAKDWPLIGENTLQLAGDDSGLLYIPVG